MAEKEKQKMEAIQNGKWEWILPTIHFIASFFYEWTILQLCPAKDIVVTVAKSSIYSEGFERIMGYCLSKLFAACFIFGLWKLLFFLIRNWKKEKSIRMLFWFFVVGGLLIAFFWPNGFVYSIDNYVTYSYAIRLFPEYWHSAYTSAIYCACLMTIPHPFAICLFQWLAFVFDLSYLWLRMERIPAFRRFAKWFVLGIFLIPGTFLLFSDPYRTEIYALLCMFYLAKILFDAIEGKQYDNAELAVMTLLGAFVAVWRTEGILLGGLGFVGCLLFVGQRKMKQNLLWFLAFVCAFLLISFPQKVGNEKYYGNDYSIINSFAVLRNVLNRSDAVLDYEGAREDLAAIEAVVPLEAIQVYGLEGYRRHNYLNGNKDINQSLVSAEVGKNYVRAFYRIALHNPLIYAQTQVGMLKMVTGLRDASYIQGTSIVLSKEYPAWEYLPWQYGREDLLSFPFVEKWEKWPVRNSFADWVERTTKKLQDLGRKVFYVPFVLICIPLMNGLIFLGEMIRFFKLPKGEKNLQKLLFAYVALLLIGQFAMIALVMPEASLSYFCAAYNCSFVLLLLYFGSFVRRQKEPGSEEK